MITSDKEKEVVPWQAQNIVCEAGLKVSAPATSSCPKEGENLSLASGETLVVLAMIDKATAKEKTPSRCLRKPLSAAKSTTFGREDEAARLSHAYQRRNVSNEREFILLTGPSGSGKTFLANAILREPITSSDKDGGYYISGKFDQLRRPEPFAPFVAAMTQLASLLTPQDVLQLKQEQLKAGPSSLDHELLLHMIPSLDVILDEGSSTGNIISSGGDAAEGGEPQHKIISNGHRQRFLVTLTCFLRMLCTSGLHICLFLDDLQWADIGSLELIHMMAESDHLKGLVLVGACRGNEVSAKDDLSFMLRSLEENEVAVTEIKLHNFDEQGVTEYVASELELAHEECQALGRMMYRQTEGNMLFLTRYLINMFASGGFYHEGERYRWDQAMLDREIGILTMVELMSIDVRRVHRDEQYICKVAACLGASFDECLLKFVIPKEELSPGVEAMIESGTVSRDKGQLFFTHDQLQRACCGLIGDDERESFHLELGQKLKANMSDKQLHAYIFIVARQVVRGTSGIQERSASYEMALLCLQACQKAMSLASFGIAAAYVDSGIDILGAAAFHDNYRLALTLYDAANEVAYCNGDNDKMQERVEMVLCNARNLHDKLQAYTTKIVALGTQQKIQEAIDTGFHVLRLLGEPVPSYPGPLHTIYAITKTKLMLSGTTTTKILNFHAIVNQDKIAAMKILNLLFIYVFLGKPEYIPFVWCRHVQLTLKYVLQGVVNLLGRSNDPSILTGEFMDQEVQGFLYEKGSHQTAAFIIPLIRLNLAVVVEDFCLAEALGRDLRELKQLRTALAYTVVVFLESVTALANYRQTNLRSRLKLARKGLKQMRVYAKEAPHNFLDRAYFLEAEIAAVTGKFSDAVTLYWLATNLAQEGGFLSQEALYCERWAVTLQCAMCEKEATRLFKRARDAYEKWGAVIAVDRMDLKLDLILK